MNYINKILTGNCKDVLKTLPDESIDCVVTSPPYWNLRNYENSEQLGMEPHFLDFVKDLLDIFIEVKRVLKSTGTCFVNLGDTYGTKSGNMNADPSPQPKNKRITEALSFEQPDVDLHKSLCMIPERFAIGMIDNGWTLRNQIIWHKPNQMPSSATDRFTVDFEKIFFFVKEPMGYYFEQQLEPYTKPMDRWGGDDLEANGNSTWDDGTGQVTYRNRNMRPNPDGKNMRTVWSINTEPFSESHFATYPEKLVERIIKSGCPIDGITLDPFSGAGTTALVAEKLGRNYVGIELNPKYVAMSEKRLHDELGLFKKTA